MTQSFPLIWPEGRPRTPASQWKAPKWRTRGSAINIQQAARRLYDELHKIRAAEIIISTNAEPRLDGIPKSERVEDPGVAVYFTRREQEYVLACDKWHSIAGNLAAIAAHVDALRGQERWGVATLEQSFAGHLRLPPPAGHEPAPPPWWEVLKIPADLKGRLTHAMIEAQYRDLAKQAHSDAGGSDARMAELNRAIEEARKEKLRG